MARYSPAPKVLLALLALILMSACGGKQVTFHYPGESLVFPNVGEPPALYVEFVNDLRTGRQRAGEGGATAARFPSDENWDAPVAQVYYQALIQDLTQTNAVAIVPLREQADYILEVDLLHMGCIVRRSAAGWLLSGMVGGAVGYALGHGAGAAGAGAVLGVGAVPVPTKVRAVCEVRLRIRDLENEPVWQEQCLGEVTKGGWESMTSRKDQQWVDQHLTVAVKRCNACLVGQLRQALVADVAASE